MIGLILGLALTLPTQGPAPAGEPRAAAAQRQDALKAQYQAELRATVAKRRAAAAARAKAARRAQAEARDLYKTELEYRARDAPFVAELQSRQAQLNAQVQSDQAWLRIARQRNLTYAAGLGAPISLGAQGLQPYDGFADYGLGRP